jgi:hypothetical protein
LSIIIFIVCFREPVITLAVVILYPLQKYPRLLLLVVTVLIPVCLNTLQFWVIDEFLRSKNSSQQEKATRNQSIDAKKHYKEEPPQDTTPLLHPQGDFNKYLVDDPQEDEGYIEDVGSSFMDQSMNLTC